ncbi:MAG: iron ABC transporter permease, partial [Acidimicrobiia bacterium]
GGGAALAFVVSMNSFGIPAVLGIPAGYPTITTRIYSDLARSADPAAFERALVLAALLVVVVLLVVVTGDRFIRTAVRSRSGGSAREPGRPESGPRGAIVVWTYLGLTTGLPLAALTLTGLTKAVGLAPVPSNWTVGNFAEAWSGDAWGATGRSLLLAAVAATVAAALGLLVRARPSVTWPGGVTAAAFAVPGSALAVAVLLAYGPWLRDTLLIVLVAYLAKFWALADRAVAGSFGSIDADATRAARVSGARPALTLRRIVLPMLRPAVMAAWLLVFLFGLHELTMSSLLYGPGTATLAVHTLNVQQLGDITVTAALAVLLTVPGLIAAVVVGRRRSR